MARRFAGRGLMGATKITTYNTTVPSGYYTAGYNSVPVYYDTAVYYDTTYSNNTSQMTIEWVDIGGEFGGFYITYETSWSTSYPVATWYPRNTVRYSDQRYCYWTDTSYSQQTWRETSW